MDRLANRCANARSGSSLSRQPWEELGVDFDQIQRDAESDVEKMSEDEKDSLFEVRLEDLEIETRARDFCLAIFKWLKALPTNPLEGMASPGRWRTSVLCPGKVHRALMGLKDEDGERSDALGRRRLHCWGSRDLQGVRGAGRSRQDGDGGASRLRGANRLAGVLVGKLLPSARSFVRPGFDEPEAVAALIAAEISK
jgi:hypothetical protein